MTDKQIQKHFAPCIAWEEIDKSKYNEVGIVDVKGVNILKVYKVGELNGTKNIAVFLDYGKQDDNFLSKLNKSLCAIKNNTKLQQQEKIQIIATELVGEEYLYTVVAPETEQSVFTVDVFFENKGRGYCFHTFINSNEDIYSIDSIALKYPHIKYIIGQIKFFKEA